MGSTQKFSTLFGKFRKRQSLRKVKLAELIGKTEGYIRKIESYDYTPPTFEICERLCKIFDLSDDEMLQFYKAAFDKRSQNDDAFKHAIDALSAKRLPHNTYHTYQGNPAKCTYHVSWSTKEQAPLLTPSMHTDLLQSFRSICDEHQVQLHSQDLSDRFVLLILDIPPSQSPDDFVRGLKALSSSALKNRHVDLIQYPAIWQNTHAIFTLGDLDRVGTNIASIRRQEQPNTVTSP